MVDLCRAAAFHSALGPPDIGHGAVCNCLVDVLCETIEVVRRQMACTETDGVEGKLQSVFCTRCEWRGGFELSAAFCGWALHSLCGASGAMLAKPEMLLGQPCEQGKPLELVSSVKAAGLLVNASGQGLKASFPEHSRRSLRMAISGCLSLRVAVTGCLSWPAILTMRTETVFPAPKPMHSQLSVPRPCAPNFQSHAHARPTFKIVSSGQNCV